MKSDKTTLNCSVADTLSLIGEGWTILIVREAFFGSRRFEDFQKHLGIARNILTTRLQKLVEGGILERTPIKQGGKRHEYKLTPMGRDLFPVLISLTQWGDRWLRSTSGPPVKFIERETGEEIAKVTIQNKAGEEIKARDLALIPGLGATDETRKRLKIMADVVESLMKKKG